MTKETLVSIYIKEETRFLNELSELLAFPSISADPAHHSDCNDCADWLCAHLNTIGLTPRIIETPSHRAVFAERIIDKSFPTVLCYGHYDVQPTAPEELWQSPPFQPTLKDGRIYARGAQDNKGQLFYVIKALETLIKADDLKINIKMIIEGDEESSGPGLDRILNDSQELLRADVLTVTDTGTVASGEPTLIMGLRGIVHLTVTVKGPDYDLHSGLHGGLAMNPATAITRILASLHNPDGSIAIPGFYDKVTPPSEKERELAEKSGFDKELYLETTGGTCSGGEQGYSAAVRLGFRPAIDINGICSGHTGPGAKTIIPSTAMAKVTARLAADQDPDEALQMIINHLKKNTPDGLTLSIDEQGVGGRAFKLNHSSELIAKAGKVLEDVTGQEAVLLWEGASIPIIPELAAAAGAEPLICGFGSERDNIHAPNESFSLEQFRKGFLYAAMILQKLGS